jgi:hypothetical protein
VAVSSNRSHTAQVAEVSETRADDVIARSRKLNVALAIGTKLVVFATLEASETLLAYLLVGGDLLLASVIDDRCERSVLVKALLANHTGGVLAGVALADRGKVGAVGGC